MVRIKRKSAFEHAQNVRIHVILRMRKVWSGLLFSIDTFYPMILAGADHAPVPKAHFRSAAVPILIQK